MVGESFDGVRDRAACRKKARRDDPHGTELQGEKKNRLGDAQTVAGRSAATAPGRQAHQVHRPAADEREGVGHVGTFLPGDRRMIRRLEFLWCGA
ncbi:hypothetical protein [Nocardia sp. NPDC004415]